mmetsp:Transcript_72074/g.134770  ORF Transcript_72074/g.134770 Transcript_72074/m.134770 type:complete len:254 (+) Transcript_72074:884-1645(+)
MVLITCFKMLISKKIIAPGQPLTPPSPSGGGLLGAPAAAAGAATAAAPLTAPLSTGPLAVPRYFSIVPGLWIMFHSSEASSPMVAMIACAPPGCTSIHLVTSYARPFTTTHASALVLCFFTSSMPMPPPPPAAAAAGAAAAPPPPPTCPRILTPLSWFASTIPGLWIAFHSSEASCPTKAMIACSPPGCLGIHSVTSQTAPLTTTHASDLVLCFATSSRVMPAGAAGAAGAAGGPFFFSSSISLISSSLLIFE